MGVLKNIKYQISNIKYLKSSFTFIELIVVIGVVGLALPVLFAIVFALLQQQTKIYRLSQVKREGDYALNVMENIIRNNVISLHSGTPPTDSNKVCTTEGSTFDTPYLQDKYTLGTWSRFYFSNDKIASESSTPPSINANLTTDKVKVTSFSISCQGKGIYSSPFVNLSFIIQYNTTSTRPEETATLNYQTKIKLRSY
ncbi:MAG: type II secretion system protein [Microgenomates group bacterium]